MKKWRVVIVEDRRLARDELKYLLSAFHPDMELVGEFDTIQSAWATIESGQVDGVFLDITFDQTGGGEKDGLMLARRISLLKPAPWIIFTTGTQEYAIDAVDFRPFGYLLKPIDDLKLEKILNLVRETFADTAPLKNHTLQNRIEIRHKVIRKAEDGHIERLTLTRYLTPDEVLYVHSNNANNSIEVYLVNDEVLRDVNLNLNGWLDLKLHCFLQTRRNIVANIAYVCGYRADSEREGNYLLQFKGCAIELPIGANYFVKLKEVLKNGQ